MIEHYSFALLCAINILCISCKHTQSNSEDVDILQNISCSLDTINTPFEGGEYYVQITTSSEWIATYNRPWVSLDRKSGNGTAYVQIKVTSGVLDSANVIFSVGTKSVTLKIIRGTVQKNGIENGREYVDLGLSVKWATMNIGSSFPTAYMYFSWGETTTKSYYNERHYKYYKESGWGCFYLLKYCNNPQDGYNDYVDYKYTLELEDDAALYNWGGNWRMPTYKEWDELRTQCTWIVSSQNGIHGYEVLGKTGNNIFLPAAGYYNAYNGLEGLDIVGSYWSSSLHETGSYAAYQFHFTLDNKQQLGGANRYEGRSIRPVHP